MAHNPTSFAIMSAYLEKLSLGYSLWFAWDTLLAIAAKVIEHKSCGELSKLRQLTNMAASRGQISHILGTNYKSLCNIRNDMHLGKLSMRYFAWDTLLDIASKIKSWFWSG